MASTGVVAVFMRANTAEKTAKSMAMQTHPMVVTQRP